MVRDDVVGGCGQVESKGPFFGFGQGAQVVGLLVDGLDCGERDIYTHTHM